MRDLEWVDLLEWALPRLGFRWPGFRRVRGQVCKRISRRMTELHVARVAEYRARLGSDPSEWEVLDGLCRITISRFWRDRAVWDRMRDGLLAEAACLAVRDGREDLRCWSAGCASGEEPYGIAILFRFAVAHAFPGLGLRVVATDADDAILERARRACFSPGAARSIPAEWVERAFERRDGLLCVRPEIRDDVQLLKQDLRRAMPDGRFEIVLCRNLAFTYFDDELQRRVLEGIGDRVAPGGFLVIGAHESLPAGAAFTPVAGRPPVFRSTSSREVATRLR